MSHQDCSNDSSNEGPQHVFIDIINEGPKHVFIEIKKVSLNYPQYPLLSGPRHFYKEDQLGYCSVCFPE